jgi:hypothetical protein
MTREEPRAAIVRVPGQVVPGADLSQLKLTHSFAVSWIWISWAC